MLSRKIIIRITPDLQTLFYQIEKQRLTGFMRKKIKFHMTKRPEDLLQNKAVFVEFSDLLLVLSERQQDH